MIGWVALAGRAGLATELQAMPHRFHWVTGFVLAGGASRRMGRDKTKLVLGGTTLLERQILLLRRICRLVGVVGLREGGGGLEARAIADELPLRGPLGGIFSGLRHSCTEYNLFLSCDMPFIEARFLRFLCERALAGGADVTIPQTPREGLQPLSAVYRRRALGPIRASLEAGEDNRVSRFFPRVPCLIVPWREIGRAGFTPRLFANLNTLEDFEDARRWFQAQAA